MSLARDLARDLFACCLLAFFLQELAELGIRGYFAEGWTWPGADMADLRVFLAGRMTFDATLDIDHLVAKFLENYCAYNVCLLCTSLTLVTQRYCLQMEVEQWLRRLGSTSS